MRRLRLSVVIFGVISLVAAAFASLPAVAWRLPWSLPDPNSPAVTLSDVERAVASKYPVPEIDGQQLSEVLAKGEVALFDVRERAEFEHSHIAGAVHVSPETSASDFLKANGAALAGKTVVFYCSVGVRSGSMAERVGKMFPAQRRSAVMNLKGGIFRWFKEGRAIVRVGGPATSVHPYDASWGKLLERPLQ